MKKLIIVLAVMIFLFSDVAYASDQVSFEIDTSQSDIGVLTVSHPQFENQKYKILIQKDGAKCYFDIVPDKQSECFPLAMGDGEYTIKIFKNISSNQYSTVYNNDVNVSLLDQDQPYKQSVQSIEWDYSMEAIKAAKTLTENLSTDEEKVKAIYNYVIKNIKYDYTKTADTISSTYLPDIEDTYSTGTGMCYDFASLFSSMLRSVDIPAKLVKGYTTNFNGYHAWNEVYINDNWETIDTTYDSIKRHSYRNYSMTKEADDYTAKYTY